MIAQKKQQGVALIEFALSFTVFWVFFMGLIEISRAMFAWNSAQEATRLAARLASICDNTSNQRSAITKQVHYYVDVAGNIDTSSNPNWLVFNYEPTGCFDNCTMVSAKTSGLKVSLTIPFKNLQFTLPEFRTLVLRESMANVIQYNGNVETNAICN